MTPHALSVGSLHLEHFRNHRELTLDIGTGPVVLTGPNGAGKTNILEAVSFLTAGKGLRSARLDTIDHRFTQMPWVVAARIRTLTGEIRIGTGRDDTSGTDKRIVKIEGEKQRGQASLAEFVSICALTPSMDQTFANGTTERRAFLDRLTLLFAPEHVRHLSIYEHARSERRRLLEQTRPDEDWLNILERRMAEQAVAIAAARLHTISYLEAAIKESHPLFPKARITVDGSVENDLRELPALQAEEAFLQLLASSRLQDRASGKTTFGTHRSDFVVHHHAKNMLAEFCSTGEQKALLLSLTLAATRAKASWSGIVPIVLLDEVIAHLDEARRQALFNEITQLNAQCWMTGTDLAPFAPLENAQFIDLSATPVSNSYNFME